MVYDNGLISTVIDFHIFVNKEESKVKLDLKSVNRLVLCFLIWAIAISCGPKGNNYKLKTSETTLRAQLGQLILLGFCGTTASAGSHIYRDITEYNLGSVVLFDVDLTGRCGGKRNIANPTQLQRLTHDLQQLSLDNNKERLIISVDQEGGRVARLNSSNGFAATKSHEEAGLIFRDPAKGPRAFGEAADLIARQLRSSGINTNLAPVVDVNTYSANPIIGKWGRSFSSNPIEVYEEAAAFINMHHDRNVITTLKHFPGHGSSRNDSHLGVVDVSKYWRWTELRPYELLLEAQKVDMIMTAHIFNSALDPDFPATLSYDTIQGQLRDTMGFDGVVVADDLQMGAIRNQYTLEQIVDYSLNAGVDILSFANNGSVYNSEIVPQTIDMIINLLRNGRLSEERILESLERVKNLKSKLTY